MTIDERTVNDIRFLLRQVADCPTKRRILEALRQSEERKDKHTGTAN